MSRRPPARRPLTPRQRDVLAAIRAHLDASGYMPTVRELGATIGVSSPQTVQFHLDALQAKGYLRRPARGYRAIELCDPVPPPAPAAPAAGPSLGLGRVPETWVRLRIPVDGQPASVFTRNTAGELACPAGHPRTPDNRWYVAHIELCRVCGRAAVADDLAARAVG